MMLYIHTRLEEKQLISDCVFWAESQIQKKEMAKSDPPEVVELFEIIESLMPTAISFNDVIVRSAGTKYANEDDFLTGNGAARLGGRWNPKGINAVYGSTDILTATFEAYQGFIDAGFSLSSLKPRVTAGANVSLESVFDLTDGAIRRSIGFSLDDLLDEDWHAIQMSGDESWTQAIGRGCFESGFEGILVASARKRDGTNLIVFPDSMDAGSSFKILGESELPPHPANWP